MVGWYRRVGDTRGDLGPAAERAGQDGDVETDLQLAQRAVLTGAGVALRHFAALADLSQEVKADGSVVTAADRAVETAIRDVLEAARPHDAILGEEHGASAEPGAGRRWIVDPIDGTALFVAGDDRWLVLVALEEDGEIVAGVAAHPAQGSVFWATRGGGAFEGRVVGGRVVAATPIRVAAEVHAAPDGSHTGSAEAVTAFGSAGGAEAMAGLGSAGDGEAVNGGGAAVARFGSAGGAGAVDGGGGEGGDGPGFAGGFGSVAGSRFSVLPERWASELADPIVALTPALPWGIHPALLVARGDLDLALQTAGQVWDFAATSIIVTEAGGSYRNRLGGFPHGSTRPGSGASVYARGDGLCRAALDLIHEKAASGAPRG
jgi:fructose-1,6-bisphosphatase/inositol monophosphatase family enzyme